MAGTEIKGAGKGCESGRGSLGSSLVKTSLLTAICSNSGDGDWGPCKTTDPKTIEAAWPTTLANLRAQLYRHFGNFGAQRGSERSYRTRRCGTVRGHEWCPRVHPTENASPAPYKLPFKRRDANEPPSRNGLGIHSAAQSTFLTCSTFLGTPPDATPENGAKFSTLFDTLEKSHSARTVVPGASGGEQRWKSREERASHRKHRPKQEPRNARGAEEPP